MKKTILPVLVVVTILVLGIAAIATSSVLYRSKAHSTAKATVMGTETQECRCTCSGATQTTKQISCTRPDGSKFTATKICWTKKDCNGKDCGTVCESDYQVCEGTANHICN